MKSKELRNAIVLSLLLSTSVCTAGLASDGGNIGGQAIMRQLPMQRRLLWKAIRRAGSSI